MFEITEGDVLLAHLNTRTEKHGEEDVGAIDLKIKCRASNTILNLLDPRLRTTFFQRAGGGQQADMHSPEHLPQRVFPHIPSFTWDDKLEGYTASIGTGLGLVTVTLNQVKVHKFKFEPVDGGTVDLTYTVSCNPSAEQVAAVYPLNGQGIILTLTPPKSDGGGAAKIKDEGVRKRQAEEGQPDILDEQEKTEQDRATAILLAMGEGAERGGEMSFLAAWNGVDQDAPDSEELVTLLVERGYVMTEKQIEDPKVLSDEAYAGLLGYLRGTGEAPAELVSFSVTPTSQKGVGGIEEVETPPATLDPPKPEKKKRAPRKGGTVD